MELLPQPDVSEWQTQSLMFAVCVSAAIVPVKFVMNKPQAPDLLRTSEQASVTPSHVHALDPKREDGAPDLLAASFWQGCQPRNQFSRDNETRDCIENIYARPECEVVMKIIELGVRPYNQCGKVGKYDK
jgi:hypothetical protein